jgi:hypothetical protein
MELNNCPICSSKPSLKQSETSKCFAIRCDGTPAGSDPRHTLYVYARTVEEVSQLWNKLK